jgi:hypothetical protein
MTTVGITIEKFLEMDAAQSSLCAICGMAETAKHKSGRVKRLSVDHCHATGKIRSLLCKRCNMGIGLFNDDVGLFSLVIEYLKRHS